MSILKRWRKVKLSSGKKWGWSEYEMLVEKIFSSISKGDIKDVPTAIIDKLRPFSEGIKYCPGKEMRGKSGHRHKFDIVLEFKYLGVDFLAVIECKYYERKVGVDDILV